MIDGLATTKHVEMGGHGIVNKRDLGMRCAKPVPAQHEQTHTIIVLRKSRRTEKMEK